MESWLFYSIACFLFVHGVCLPVLGSFTELELSDGDLHVYLLTRSKEEVIDVEETDSIMD